jgi:hypothetical protein
MGCRWWWTTEDRAGSRAEILFSTWLRIWFQVFLLTHHELGENGSVIPRPKGTSLVTPW